MNVYTYYMEVPGLWSDESQRALLRVWEDSWRARGWTPCVLHENHAKAHPEYEAFKKRFWECPTPFGHDYEGHCFMRWVAMACVGGGFMVDYDVINYSFPPVAPDPECLTIISDTKQAPWCGVIAGPGALFDAMAHIFLRSKDEDGEWLPEQKIFHCEDQVFLRRMIAGTLERPGWLRWFDGCSLFPDVSGALVHYTSRAMLDAGRWPKHEHIDKIRPI